MNETQFKKFSETLIGSRVRGSVVDAVSFGVLAVDGDIQVHFRVMFVQREPDDIPEMNLLKNLFDDTSCAYLICKDFAHATAIASGEIIPQDSDWVIEDELLV